MGMLMSIDGTTKARSASLTSAWHVVIVFGVLGCGSSVATADASSDGTSGGGGVVSCTVSQSDGTRTYNVICIEGSAALRMTVQAACTGPDSGSPGTGVSNTGHLADAPCSHADAVGGCRVTFGGNSQTSWYYSGGGFNVAQIQQVCTSTGTYVAP
jgi:hypothetical protein